MRNTIFKALQLLPVSLLSVWFANNINVFSFFSFVPEEHVMDVGLTTYFTIFGLLCDQLILEIKNNFKSELTVIMSVKGIEESIDSIPKIIFNKKGLAEADLRIQVYGKKKHFINAQLQIPAYNFATMQVSPKSRETFIDGEGNLIVNLEGLFSGGQEKYRNEITINIVFIEELEFSKRDIEIKPVLRRTSKHGSIYRISYKCNSARLIEKE